MIEPNEQLSNINLTNIPDVFEIEEGDLIPFIANSNGEYEEFIPPPPDLNMRALDAIESYVSNYKSRSYGMGDEWVKVMAQSHIQMIIQFLQENL
jgi:hypothetical protein